MPTYRKLHTKVLDSFDFAEMPDDFTRVFWLLLIVAADSEGRMIDNPAWIRSRMFPMRSDVTGEQIESALSWLAQRGMVVRYRHDGRGYFYVERFKEYQSGTEKEAKSTLPAPPEPLQTYSKPTPDQLQSNSIPAQELPRPSVYESVSVNESVNASESEPDDFEKMRNLLETTIGVPATSGDVQAIQECEKLGVTAEDIRGALKWRFDNGRQPVKTITGLLPGIKTSRNRRVQRESARKASDPGNIDYTASLPDYEEQERPHPQRLEPAQEFANLWRLFVAELSPGQPRAHADHVAPHHRENGTLVFIADDPLAAQFAESRWGSTLKRQFLADIKFEVQERETA